MAKEEKKEKVEMKEITAIYKVHLHCPKCADDIRKPLLRTPGVQSVDVKFEKGEITVKGVIDEKKIHKQIERLSIHNVKTDMKAQTITIDGIIESEKLVTYMKKRVHKHAEIIPPKKEEKKEKEKEKEKEKKEEKKEKVTVEVKTTETTKIVEFTEEKKVEAKTAEGKVPYFVHYVYAPQMFSDENPNACSIM
ncbi:hypothetical protein CsSME_00012178 [Camellia sinensis var. sinensis]